MCGIAGSWSAPLPSDELVSRVEVMTNALVHRGPDDCGTWVDARCGLGLGHRRLSILDLSPEGHQPMFSVSGRYVIAFNGEVFNFEALRKELPTTAWRGHSDTEVLLAAIETWGLSAAVRRLVGMFAFALWDRHARRLHLVRDRLGIKPLCYGWNHGSLLFASELKAICQYPDFDREIDRSSIVAFLRHNYIPAPHTIYRGMFKLRQGTIATFTSASQPARVETYWSGTDAALEGVRHQFVGSDADAVEELHRLLSDAVGLRMIADVPLGAFLSGGIDSSLVVALMQAQSTRPVRTFSIGFSEAEFDEAPYAAKVAYHLGTDHTEMYVTDREALDAVPAISVIHDEPFADSSQLPTFLLAHMTRRHVKVSLSGDGGDELFAGYTRYFWVDRVWRKLHLMPRPVRGSLGKAIRMAHPARWDAMARPFAPYLPARQPGSSFGGQLSKLSRLLLIDDPTQFYREFISHSPDPCTLSPDVSEATTAFDMTGGWRELPDYFSQMQCLDTVTYLPDDILVKVDRASMAVSLEARVPLLDHRVVEMAWRLPLSMKVRDGQGKWIIRQVLKKYVPLEMFDRPKMGFGVPLSRWLRGALREWAEDLLQAPRLASDGILDVKAVRQLWEQHLAGTHNWQYQVWNLLMLQAWLESTRNQTPVVCSGFGCSRALVVRQQTNAQLNLDKL